MFAATCLAEVVRWHGGATDAVELDPVTAPMVDDSSDESHELADVVGQADAVDALVVAAAVAPW